MLVERVARRRAEILGSWFKRILAGYPEETARFLRQQKDPFANPVGAGIREEIGPILDGLVAGCPATDLGPALDRIVRIRAVQDFKPARALEFILDLKQVIRAELADELSEPTLGLELAELDGRIDRLMLVAFDVYMECREKIYSIRVDEIRNRSLKLMERMNEWRTRRGGAPAEAE